MRLSKKETTLAIVIPGMVVLFVLGVGALYWWVNTPVLVIAAIIGMAIGFAADEVRSLRPVRQIIYYTLLGVATELGALLAFINLDGWVKIFPIVLAIAWVVLAVIGWKYRDMPPAEAAVDP